MKKATKPRPVNVEVCFLPDFQKNVPRGKTRRTLQKVGRIRRVPVYRHSNEPEVRQAIRKTFTDVDLPDDTQWMLLEVYNKNMLRTDPEAILNSEYALERRGGLYICKGGSDLEVQFTVCV